MNVLSREVKLNSIAKAIVCCCILLLLYIEGSAQNNVNYRPVDTVLWEKVTRDIDYSGDEVKESKLPNIQEPKFKPTPKAVKIFLFVLIGGLLTYFITYFLRSRRGEDRMIVDDEFFYNSEEKEIKKLNLEGMLANALAEKNFRLAIRIRYLIIIRRLSELRLIDWQREKTNKDYLREVKNSTYFSSFAEITNLFNRVWYGDLTIDEERYNRVSPAFEDFMEQLNNPVIERAVAPVTESTENAPTADNSAADNTSNSVNAEGDTDITDNSNNSNTDQQEV